MTTAIFLIVSVAFVARLITTAAALRNWWLAIGVAASALGVYSLTRLGGSSLYATIGDTATFVLDAVCCAIGYLVPTFAASTDRRGRAAKAFAIFIGVLASAFVIEVVLNRPITSFWLRPDLWFVIGVAAYVVLKSQFYEREDVGRASARP